MNKFISFFTFNKTIFSGSMDMIVIKQPDGKLKSTPLNVRFGNFRVIKAKYKRVKVNVNGKDIPLQMKLNEFGQAYVLRKKYNKKYKKKDSKDDNLNDKSSGSESFGENSDKSDKSDDNEEIHKNSKSLPRKEERNFNNNEYHSPEIGMRFEFKNKNVLNNDKNNNNSKNNIFTIKYKNDENENKENNENNENKENDDLNNINNNNNIIQDLNIEKNSFENINNENSFENQKNVNLNINNLSEKNINLNNENKLFFNDKNIFELSNCWSNIYKKKSNKNFNAQEEFEKNKISEEEFFKDPWKVLNNNNLAIKYGNMIYTWKVIAPMIISELAYNKPLPENMLNELTQNQGRFFFWKTIEKDAFKIDINKLSKQYEEEKKKNNLNNIDNNNNNNINNNKNFIEKSTTDSINSQEYVNVQTPRLSNSQLKKLNLKYGRNKCKFSITSEFYGVNELECDIYLWNYDDKIIISDFDGTVTRSDVIGQILGGFFNVDWFHKKIIKLFNHLVENQYKIIYLTARSMTQHDKTMHYLYSIKQDNKFMPRGPLIMSPDNLTNAFAIELLYKIPEQFKKNCLKYIKYLFPIDASPFYAGFGNKISDRTAYESVGINDSRIFIINEKGEIQTSNKRLKLTYENMDENVDEMFPYVKDKGYSSMIFDEKIIDRFEYNKKSIIESNIDDEINALLKEKQNKI